MATPHVRAGGTVTIDSVDLSDRITGADVKLMVDDVAAGPTMGQGDLHRRRHEGGAREAELAISWIGDYAAGSVFDTLRTRIGQVVPVTVQPADNLHTFNADMLMTGAPFITGSVGALTEFTTTWMTADNWRIDDPPPSAPLWHTTLRVGDGSGERQGFNRHGSDFYGRLTDDDLTVSGNAVTLLAVYNRQDTDQLWLRANPIQHLDGYWIRFGDSDDQTVELAGITETGNDDKSFSFPDEDWATDRLIAVSIWDRDPTGTSWASTTTPHRLWHTTMTVGNSGTVWGYRSGGGGFGSVGSAEISTPDGNQTLSRFEIDSTLLSIRMGTSAEAGRMHGLWFRWSTAAGDKIKITGNTNTTLTHSQNGWSPGWLDGQTVTLEVWDQDPDN